MNSRERIHAIIARTPADRCGFWLGNPHESTLPIYHKYFGTTSLEGLHHKLGSDFRWLTPQYAVTTYRHPQGKGLFDQWKCKKSLGDAGPFSEFEDAEQVHAYEWPNLEYLDFTEGVEQLHGAGDKYRASGFWMPFFHDVMDLFGMESLMISMYTRPDIVHAAFEHVCGFYYEANERFFDRAGCDVDGVFFGNDFGTQRDLLLAPDQFDTFILPWIKKFSDQAHRRGYQVLLHSCGSIHRIIRPLLAAGIDCLHPLQALAHGMDAETLAREYQGEVAFLGGVDTQHLLIEGTPQQIKEEVRRIKQVLGPHLIVSPSHESLLPNVPPRNVAAMAEAALE